MVCSFVKRLALAFISLAVTGCGSQGPTSGVPATFQVQHSSAATSAPLIYVANEHFHGGRFVHASLLGFSSDANGNVPPVVKIRGVATGMGHYGGLNTSVGVDKSGRLYMTGGDLCEIGVWPAGSNGDESRTAEFSVDCDSFGGPPISFVLDGQGDTWAASWEGDYTDGGDLTSIIEYPPVPTHARGQIALNAMRKIIGPRTGMHRVVSIALNGKGQVSVQETNGPSISILTFADTASGDASPFSRLAGDKTQLSGVGYEGASGIAYDSLGRLVACSNSSKPSILTFAPGAQGNVAPISTLLVPGCSSITLDPQDNIYIAFQDSILVYAAGAVGSAQPIRIIKGNRTTLSWAYSVAF